MRMLLITAGSRGDVEPFVALARRLEAEGHSPRLVIPDDSDVDVAGLEVTSLGVSFRDLVGELGVSPLAAARAFRERIRPAMVRVFEAGVREVLNTEPDVVLNHPKVLSARDAAAAVGAAHALLETVPTLTATREFPAPGVVNTDVGRFNPLTYRIARVAEAMFRRDMKAATASLPDHAASRQRAANRRQAGASQSLMPISPVLLPPPRDWPDTAHLTGAWNPGGQSPPLSAEVQQFVDGGAFVYAGFGSMAAGNPTARGRAIVAACRARGLRVLVATGWGGIEVPSDIGNDDVLVVEHVPHASVLPLAAAAIHHGGAGTSHAGVRAGVPSVVVPFIADQPFWGRLLHRRSFGGRPVGYRHVSAPRIGRSLDEALKQRDRVLEASVELRSEDGTGVAVDVLERLSLR